MLLGGGAAKSAADIGTGEKRLLDLVRPGVWMALAQLAVAFVLLAASRGDEGDFGGGEGIVDDRRRTTGDR